MRLSSITTRSQPCYLKVHNSLCEIKVDFSRISLSIYLQWIFICHFVNQSFIFMVFSSIIALSLSLLWIILYYQPIFPSHYSSSSPRSLWLFWTAQAPILTPCKSLLWPPSLPETYIPITWSIFKMIWLVSLNYDWPTWRNSWNHCLNSLKAFGEGCFQKHRRSLACFITKKTFTDICQHLQNLQ